MSSGVYDQLSQLSQTSPVKTPPVGSPDASKSGEIPLTVQSSTTAPKRTATRPTQSHNANVRDTSESTSKVTSPRDLSREISSESSRGKARELPTREEIQEFTFRLRDDLKIKVQAEVPHQWQDELEDLARTLDVKKLELYRYIIGEFLGKVERKRRA